MDEKDGWKEGMNERQPVLFTVPMLTDGALECEQMR